jgi:hypothetical protein
MVTHLRMITLSLLLALLLGTALASQADAQVFRPKSPAESERLALKEECKQGGGTQFQSVYHYRADGSVQSISTTCHGGAYDGETHTIQ